MFCDVHLYYFNGARLIFPVAVNALEKCCFLQKVFLISRKIVIECNIHIEVNKFRLTLDRVLKHQ